MSSKVKYAWISRNLYTLCSQTAENLWYHWFVLKNPGMCLSMIFCIRSVCTRIKIHEIINDQSSKPKQQSISAGDRLEICKFLLRYKSNRCGISCRHTSLQKSLANRNIFSQITKRWFMKYFFCEQFLSDDRRTKVQLKIDYRP